MMKKNVWLTFLVSALFLISGRETLWAQQDGVNRSELFSVYSKRDIASRNMTYRDTRLMKTKGFRTKFSMPAYQSLGQWKKRRKYLQNHILISAGLWPHPSQTPLHTHMFGKIVHKKYTVEKVYIEPYPHFYLAGNLYKPRGITSPLPGVLMPHGHWKRGRLQNGTPPSGHANSVSGRCIHFAKAGYVAFSYDMVGYGDTRQIGHDFAAGDSLAQLWNINLLGLQLWDSMQALRFLRSLPVVDSTRIGITGASGGGTQTFFLDAVVNNGAIDVSAPVNQISSIMQGGDNCEDAPGLRLNTFNVEIAGIFAPRPQIMISDTHDWTKNTPWAEYPMMRSIYELYNAAGHVDYRYFDYPHNYNRSSREAVYRWFHRWMPGKATNYPIREQPFSVEPDSSLLVFLNRVVLDRDRTFEEMDPSRYHNLPAGALQMDEPALKRYLKKTAKQQLEKYWPATKAQWSRFDSLYGGGYRHILAGSVPKNVDTKVLSEGAEKNFQWKKILLARAGRRDWIPAVLFEPSEETKAKQGDVTLIVTPTGKKGIANRSGTTKLVQNILDRGHRVMAIDVFKTGEHVLPEGVQTQRDEGASDFTTFNKTDTQQRVQDILTAGRFLKKKFPREELNLVGLRQAGIWGMLAAPLAPMFTHVICDENHLNPDKPSQWLPFFVPGLLKYGHLQTALVLAGNQGTKVTMYNINSTLDKQKIKEIYRMFGHTNNLSIHPGKFTTQGVISALNQVQ